MTSPNIGRQRSCVATVRRERGPQDVTTRDQAAAGVGRDASWAASLKKAPHTGRADEASVGGPVHMTTRELEAHLVRAVAVARMAKFRHSGADSGRANRLERFCGVVLRNTTGRGGVAGNIGRVGAGSSGTGGLGYRCNAESSGKTVSGMTGTVKLILKAVLRHETYILGEGGQEHDRDTKESDVRIWVLNPTPKDIRRAVKRFRRRGRRENGPDGIAARVRPGGLRQ